MNITGGTKSKLARGDNEAWTHFLEKSDRLIQAIVSWPKWRFTPQAREDVAQQIRMDLVKAAADLTQASRPDYFVKTIGIRRCVDEVRRQIRERTHLSSVERQAHPGAPSVTRDLPAGKDWDPVHHIFLAERAALLAGLINDLQETCRSALRQFYADGLSYKAMAQKSGLSVNTVGSRLSKCLDKLRERIEQNPDLREDLSESID